MTTALPILIIEDEHALGSALELVVRRIGHLPELVATGSAGLQAASSRRHAAVVLDIGLPDMSGLEVLRQLRAQGRDVPVLIITAHATLDHAIAAQKSGATDYLTKPLDLGRFERTLGALISPAVVTAAAPAECQSATLIGAAPVLREAFLGIARACAGNMPALITGPKGSGKSLAAAVIHAQGRSDSGGLHVIDCAVPDQAAAIPPPGSGTLVLDEVHLLPQPLQSRWAEFLSSLSPGSPRILATTSLDPAEALGDGRLRDDLYYALATLTIPLPPLRERSGDIPALSALFAGLHTGVSTTTITSPAMAALQAYPWPGNVRELKHVIDYAVSLSGGGPVFLSHLPPQLTAAGAAPVCPPGELESALARWLDASLEPPEPDRPDYETLLGRIEAILLKHLMDRHDHKPTRLAAAMRLHRATLRQKLRRAGLGGDDG